MSRNNIADAENFFETASKEELIDYLVKTIQKEVSKGDDADCDLVRECSDWLEELTEDEVTFTPEELEHKLEELKAGSTSEKPVKIRKKATRKTFVRVALIAAVIFAISLASLSTVAMNNGYGSAWEYIVKNIGRVLGMNEGELINEGDITFIKNTETLYYSSVEEVFMVENIHILYPKVLPNGVKINKIYQTIVSDNKYIISFVFSNDTFVYDVSNYQYTDLSLLDGCEILCHNGIEYYISSIDGHSVLAICQFDNWEYTIRCSNYDELLFVIKNMKG